jgi:basic amino acid/polyamine antiporter, APA family
VPLVRIFRLRELVLLIIGAVIGSGIFLVPSLVLRQVGGRTSLAFLAWVVGGVLSLLGALTYGELGARVPQAGGLYIYIRDCFGRLPAFLYGWTLLFVISSGTVATLSVAFSTYLSQFVALTPLTSKTVSVLMITLIGAINVRGTRQSAMLQNWTTTLKLMSLLALSVVLLIFGRHYDASTPVVMGGSLLSGFGFAMISVLWAYEGWQYCTFSAGETIDPKKNFPRAFLIGVAVVMLVYLLGNVGYIVALGTHGVMASDNVATTALNTVLGPSATTLVALAIVVSIFSAANAFILTSTRVYYAMAIDGVFFKRLAELHPRYGTPSFAVFASCVCAAVLAVSGTFQQLLTYVVFSGWIFYALGAGSIFIYRRRNDISDSGYSVPGYPWTPIVFIMAAAALVLNVIISEPRHSAVGLSVVLLGTPVYFSWTALQARQQKHEQTSAIESSE